MTEYKAHKCVCGGKDTEALISQHRAEQANLEVRIDAALKQVRKELLSAMDNFPPYRSAHEGVAIIEEEFLEFRKAAFWPHKTKSREEEEVTQLAAMAVRYLIDVVYKGAPR